MTLGRVVGTVVATRKDQRLEGFKLLVVRGVSPDGKGQKTYVVAVDTVDAGVGELVLVVAGSSARMAFGCQDRPVDAAVVGVIDKVDLAPEVLAGERVSA
ncbi:MAG: EutN/CcmL family microcompartment protein [Acidobacteriota bacterium]